MSIELTQLLGLPNVYVERQSIDERGIIFYLKPLAPGILCGGCGQFTDREHQARPLHIRDLKIRKMPVFLHIPRRQFYCQTCERYCTEQLDFVDWRRRHTRRFEQDIYERVPASSLEQIAREEGISPDEVRGMFEHVARQLKKRLGPRQAHQHR
ncbi:helix-turn-helix domain-containing protein [Gloeobacter morelensis]|uniref:Transposase family protein n=1 Tax=Gloeobacter morelensis MG652769 TaxID=2781736 RepID=A0ABY3PPM4_9CYAN|nr:helix-turn-helix domain-containing protein [Gloeobacter morelensis]UFP95493.1 transposase family protein [Gloeobacter morelensis MG652769]